MKYVKQHPILESKKKSRNSKANFSTKENTAKKIETTEQVKPAEKVETTEQVKPAEKVETTEQVKPAEKVETTEQVKPAVVVKPVVLTINTLFGSIFTKEEKDKWILTNEDHKRMAYIGSQDVKSWSYTPDDTDEDPIIKIVDLFQQAHQLYFTPQIPSGRPKGRVSQKTWLEYTCVAKENTQWNEESAPSGPFILNSIFNKWRDGIESLFKDKELRKIFANSKFKVKNTTLSSDDNKETKLESIKFINEAGETTSSNSSDKQGEIIFNFMRNMLDKNRLADFDSNKSKLMFDYFGIKGNSVDKLSYNGNRLPIKERDIEPNTFFWTNTPFTYDKLDKKFFIMPASKERVYICIGLQKEDFNFSDNNKDNFRGNYFYYWLNDDKVIKDWISIKYPKFKLMPAVYSKNEGIQGIGLLDIVKANSLRTVAIKNTDYEWYLIESKGSNTSYENSEVKQNQSKKYPTISGKVALKMDLGDTRLDGYSQLTNGKDLTFYECGEEMYKDYLKFLTQKVKDKLKAAVMEYKSPK